jgi:8-oxo-dGTP pyrophosphatase MutT (NUDIX family)
MSLIVGVAILLRSGGQFLFEIQKAANWRRRPDGLVEIGMGCIGGSLQPQETPRQAIEREVREEIDCGVEIEPAPRTFLVDARGAVRRLAPREVPEGAFFLWERARGGPGFIPGARVAVYLGRVLGDPAPGDLPAILEMALLTLRESLDGTVMLQDLLDRGALLREREPVPRRARVRPVDTARVVAELMVRVPLALRGL